MYLQNCDLFLSVAKHVLPTDVFEEIVNEAHTEMCAKAGILGILQYNKKRIKPGQFRLLINLLGQTTDYWEYQGIEKFGDKFNPQQAWEETLEFSFGWDKKSLPAKFTCRICGAEFIEQRHLVEDPVCNECLPGEFVKLFQEIVSNN